MPKNTTDEQRERLVADMRKEEAQRQASYREKALKLFPHVCGRCAREFEGKKLRELTVHHRDHNHDNNPPDGSNWELLCIYCHDHEHTRGIQEQRDADSSPNETGGASLVHSPFAALAERFKK
ncbi:YajD family HNH nuclease [Geoalkalibacter subterraneus]|uniref:Putative HNH nuclease YajD n=1 Tax=Geoalkalibacter subterraneus TaxID=483547 RepID=A0A0B5FP15_9BACT|nr:YajD family HNH nuclease [Geoalkalibacter subterraneus]AJF06404.1 restriction endonuclease [Geoalkalibacter subterraneus]